MSADGSGAPGLGNGTPPPDGAHVLAKLKAMVSSIEQRNKEEEEASSIARSRVSDHRAAAPTLERHVRVIEDLVQGVYRDTSTSPTSSATPGPPLTQVGTVDFSDDCDPQVGSSPVGTPRFPHPHPRDLCGSPAIARMSTTPQTAGEDYHQASAAGPVRAEVPGGSAAALRLQKAGRGAATRKRISEREALRRHRLDNMYLLRELEAARGAIRRLEQDLDLANYTLQRARTAEETPRLCQQCQHASASPADTRRPVPHNQSGFHEKVPEGVHRRDTPVTPPSAHASLQPAGDFRMASYATPKQPEPVDRQRRVVVNTPQRDGISAKPDAAAAYMMQQASKIDVLEREVASLRAKSFTLGSGAPRHAGTARLTPTREDSIVRGKFSIVTPVAVPPVSSSYPVGKSASSAAHHQPKRTRSPPSQYHHSPPASALKAGRSTSPTRAQAALLALKKHSAVSGRAYYKTTSTVASRAVAG
ncbi:hypothetical protein DIPPA_26487 [Diplonema papillatum]|nr:hypothetical protein DIPPA_26487 [Diplonema papillatum]